MKSPNSSISVSDRPRAFLAAAVLTVALTLGVVGGCAWLVKWQFGWTQNAPLLRFHAAKSLAGVDTVFVGDSSLGNAIDSALFSRLTGHKSVNLALNGSFGFGGTLGMLECAVERSPSIRNVVVMQTADMMSRPEHMRGLILADQCGAVAALPLSMRIAALRAVVAEVRDWKALRAPPRRLLARLGVVKEERPFVFGPDYPVQGRPVRISYSNFYLTRTQPAAAQMLSQIALLCRRKGLNCLYAHGPLAAPALARSDRYLAEAATGITGSGLTLVTAAPPPLSTEAVGNSQDHVAPPYKSVTTREYAEIIKPRLR